MALDDLYSAINLATGEVVNNDDPMSRLDSAIDNVTTARKKRSATVTSIATKFNPDQIAQARNFGRQVGLPDAIAERNPEEVRRKFISKKVEELYDTSPVAGRKLADPEFAKLAHDITDELRGNEDAIKQLALTKKGFRAASELSRAMSDQSMSDAINRAKMMPTDRGIGDVVGSFSRSVAAGVLPRAGQGIYGALATPFGALAPYLDPLVGTVLPANPLRVAEQGLLDLSKNQSNVAEAITGDTSDQGFVERAVNSGFESLGMNLPPLIAGVYSGNPSIALNAMVGITGGQEYAKARASGLDANQALVYAGSQAAVEWATEKIPVETLFKGLRGEDGLLKTLLLSNVQEQIGEQAATVLQDLNEWAVLNPEKPFSEYLAERPEAAAQTAIATLVGTTGQVAIAKSIEAAGNYVSTEQEKLQFQSEAANQSMQAFAQIQKLAEQSKLKQRSAQDFATFLQEAGGENGINEVYVDARQFAQEAEKLGIDLNTLLQSSPVINQQLEEAIAQGTDLVIPVGEFGANIAGTDFGGAILQHLRADENGISAFEAQTQLDSAVEELQRQAETVAQKYQADEAWTQSLTEVSDNLLGQLNAVGRFTRENNQAYVNGLIAPWYSTLASNLGITPSEAFARYPLQVSGDIAADGFEQANSQIDTPQFKNWFGESKVVDAEGKPLVVYHGTAADFTEFKKSKATDKQGRKLGMGWGKGKFYFASSGEAASSSAEFAEMTGRGNQKNVMPVYISIKNPIDAGQYTQLIQEQVDAGKDMDSAIALVDKSLKKQGVDGIIDSTTGGHAVFEPTQIKSAIGNNGNFNPNDANILNQSEQLKLYPVFKAITENDEVFKYGKSESKDLAQIFEDIAAGTMQVQQVKSFDDSGEVTYKINPISASGEVNQKSVGFVTVFPEGKVEINVSQIGKGYRGSLIYAAVSNFAYNNGLVFTGDREGITTTGSLRRLENMISTALKFGTTDHIEPHPDQARDLNINWIKGDTEHNIEQMLIASYKAITEGVYETENPGTSFEITSVSDNAVGVDKIKDIIYDLDSKQFKDLSNGQPFTDSDFAELAKSDRARQVNAGSTTLKRAAIASTLLREPEGLSRTRFLDGISKLGLQSELLDTQLKGVLYQKDEIKELVAQHNLSAENLLFADRMGGLAVPSLAVTKKQNILEGFGEITLLAAPEMVDPKGYAKAKVFGADIYSPRYPQITYQYDSKALQGLQDMFADAVKATGERSIDTDRMEDDPHDALRRNTATKYQFLKDNGIQPDVVFKQPNEKQASMLNAPELAPFIQDNIDPYELFTNQAFVDANFAYLTRTRAEEGKETFEVNDDGKRNLAKNAAYELRESVESSKGVVDRYATQTAINNQFNKQLNDQYQVYIDGIVKGLNAKEKLYNGRTPSGFKKYIDHTLENVVKALKKELRGGENWNYGLGSVRAKYTPEFKSIAEIRKNKNRLMDNGNFEDVKNEMDDALQSIADGLDSFHVFSGSVLENTASMLRDAVSMGIPRALKNNGFENVSNELQQEIAEFMTHLKNMPTEYFEVKILRDVAITEFSGAVVPKNVDARVIEVLQKNGVNDIRYYDESTPGNRQEVIGQFENLLFQKANESARGQISFGNDITQGANITLLKNADASTFIHELGHFFLEVYADVASNPDAPQQIVDDMNILFDWFGIESTEQPALDVWRRMTIDEKRAYHEKLARGFEQYAMEGTAPTLELSRVFAKLRSFMLSAYKSLKQFFERSGDPGLTKEVRQVFDRMLAADEAINKAQAVRGMMPIFASMEEAGMSIDEYAEYLQNQQDATDEAKAALTARSLRDMKWLQGARSRVIRDLQRQADTERRAVRMQVRREVMTQPVYQAYLWLKQIPDETKAEKAEKVKATKGVDVEKDSLYTAIAKLGGLNRELAAAEWGLDPKDRFDSGVFGKPVLRKEGGLSVDQMAEALSQYNYLTVDETGKWDLHEFEDKFFEEARGEKQFSLFAEGEQYRKWQESIYDDMERARLDAFGKGKLDLNSMKAMYGEDGEWRNLGIGRTGMVMTDGVAPDAVAELFGFNSGDQLIKSLLEAENPKELIDRLTDERMLAEFGDLVDPRKINEAADKAVHNEVRARVLATELSAQNKALGNRRLLDAAAREYANRQVAKQLVRDLKPSKYTRAESKSAQLAEKATKQGDTQTAVQAKRDQLLNNRAARATVEAIDKIESTLKYLKKFDSEGVRKNLDIEYLEQIDDILSRFDLRSGQSLKAIDKRKSLLQWVESQKEIGLSPVVDEYLLNEARLISYKDLPFEQFMALADSINNIEHLGRLKKTLLTAKDNREFAERMAEARASINDNANRIVPERATPNDFVGKLARFGRRFSAAHRKFSSFMRELDGGKDLGVMQDMLLYSMYEAGSLETDLRAKATEDLQLLFAQIEGKMDRAPGNLYAVKRVVPGTNISLTHEQRIMFAMNWGNDGNRQRLLDGGLEGTRSISNEDAAAILDTITKEEWDFIQGVWDYIATYKPMIAEQELRLTGREPVWIEPSPVNTKFGTYAGGYFPAKYDAQMSTRSESLEAVTDLRMAMKGAFNAAGTRDGYTQARAEAVKGRPILLSFDTISRHIHEVTHRLAWQEWLTDATRVIKALDADIREKLGAEALQEMHQHIRDVAIGDAPVTGTTDVLLSRIRNGTSIVGMGYRVSTALMQPSGIFQSWARLGINATANGVKAFLKNPIKTHQWVMENSPMMRNRASTLNREINEIVNQVRAGKNLTRLQASYFYLIGKMQMMIDTPTYLGAYEKALSDLNYENAATEDERQAIEKKAHSFAGQTVIDTQTSGEIKDLAGVQKGSQGQKLFTNFYSYFSALYNLNVENFRTKKLTNPAEFADFVATALLLNVMPVIYTVALKNMLKGECDWDDTECLLSRYKSEQMGAIFGQMIGVRDIGVAADVATGGDAYGYSGPPSLKFFSEIYKFGQQADQGDIDMPMFKALNNAGGIMFHYPAGQINTTVEGMLAIERGEVEGVNIFGALISGPPRE